MLFPFSLRAPHSYDGISGIFDFSANFLVIFRCGLCAVNLAL